MPCLKTSRYVYHVSYRNAILGTPEKERRNWIVLCGQKVFNSALDFPTVMVWL